MAEERAERLLVVVESVSELMLKVAKLTNRDITAAATHRGDEDGRVDKLKAQILSHILEKRFINELKKMPITQATDLAMYHAAESIKQDANEHVIYEHNIDVITAGAGSDGGGDTILNRIKIKLVSTLLEKKILENVARNGDDYVAADVAKQSCNDVAVECSRRTIETTARDLLEHSEEDVNAACARDIEITLSRRQLQQQWQQILQPMARHI